MTPATTEIKDRLARSTAQPIEDPLEYYEVLNHEFGNKVPVVVSWDGRHPTIRADLKHYREGNRIKRWELASGKIHQIPRSLADYLNGLTVPDPVMEVDPKTGQMVNNDPYHRRKRYSCILKRDYVPPQDRKESA